MQWDRAWRWIILFNSYIFLFAFLPLILLLWWGLSGDRRRLAILTLGSYVFYGYWDWRFTLLMLASTVVDYEAGRRIAAGGCSQFRRRLWLIASLGTNLSLLGFFKYYDFAAKTLGALAADGSVLPYLNVILPVGISFYTFQSMSYTIDIYRHKTEPVRDFISFACYVSMFPQLVAGPIVRFVEIEQQLRNLRERIDFDYVRLGVFFFTAGMVKKIFFADMVAGRADPLLAQYESLGFFGSWAAMLGYTFQIYFDFSGYSDMAVGLGYLLGFKLPINFNSPYKACNISDFWNRWHMSLSSWLRDYLYIPLGGSRKGRIFTLRNLAITMFLGGLWHGAAWTFVVWGLYHGALLILYHLISASGLTLKKAWVNRGATFLAVIVGWVFFRSDSFGMAWRLLGSMSGLNGFETWQVIRYQVGFRMIGMLGMMLLWVWAVPNTWEIRMRELRIPAWVPALALLACVLWLDKESPFLYFQF